MSSVEFKEIGEDVCIYPLAKIISPHHVTIGSHVIVDDYVFIGAHERLVIGNHVHIASHASITGGGVCLLSDFCGISSGVRILTGTDDFSGAGLTGPTIPPEFRVARRDLVVIGPHVVIGANSVILPGVKIAEGVTVGAGAVVTRDLEPWSICVGAPARMIKRRRKETILDMEQALYHKYGAPKRRFRNYPADFL